MGKLNKKRLVIIMAILLFAVFIIGLLIFRSTANNPLKTTDEIITIEVKEGEGFNSLLNRLDSEGIIKNKLLIKLNLKMKNQDINLIPGTYEVENNITLNELITTLQTEDLTKNQISITIPEGYDIEEISKLFEEKGIFSSEQFINAVKEYPLPTYVKENSNKKYNLEGFLYPDTYSINKNSTPEHVIKLMNDKFNNVIKKVGENTGKEINEDEIEKIITIASLIEEEAQLDDERKLVSSVIYNRLNKGMKLEFCSTINYAWGEHLEKILNKHLAIDSPYNTYKNSGLPVGPIDNPGIKSIEAAVDPEETNYLYFMLLYNQGGKHHYSTTGEEHQKVKLEEEAKERANK